MTQPETMPGAAAFLLVDRLSAGYGAGLVLRDLSFDVQQGEFFTLVGPSGCGKTTTLRCIAGLEQPTGGTIQLNGVVVADADRGISVPSRHRSLGVVFQSYALWPHMTAAANIGYPLRVRGLAKPEIAAAVKRTAHALGLEHLLDRHPWQLSGGQQQRVAIARAVVHEPALLLLDEPLTNLDAGLRESALAELRELQRRLGITTIFVTHDHAEALAVSDRIAVLDEGRLVRLGEPGDVYSDPRSTFVARFVGNANTLRGRITDVASGDADACCSVEIAPGLRLDARGAPASAHAGSEVTVSIRPERISLSRRPASTATLANVLDRTFRGDRIQFRLALGDVTLVATTMSADPDMRDLVPGDTVYVDLCRSDCRVVST